MQTLPAMIQAKTTRPSTLKPNKSLSKTNIVELRKISHTIAMAACSNVTYTNNLTKSNLWRVLGGI
ncbi:hypothetical protein A9306_05450 [Moraxella atlantae]|uniref:Uncharacterized protein n=1 Tax=Faucicola atlantae TaxID=34059 RepID=A0A1B8QJP3_9GAMM|nr:hypothetical protein A9306_05450 [Moraxella atlantae]